MSLPYVHVADLEFLGIHLHPFGLLVMTGVLVGIRLAKWRARRAGYDLDKLDAFIHAMLLVGFASAHVLDALAYHPRDVLARPWSLLFFWEGIGSFSGFVGALAGVVLWRRYAWAPVRTLGPWTVRGVTVAARPVSWLVRRPEPLPILPFADLILSVFPIAWIFGRAGCSVAHDHPGRLADPEAPLAVAFPSPNPSVIEGPGQHLQLGPIHVIDGHFPRYDLGTLELFFTVGLAVAFLFLWRRRSKTGTYAAITCLAYAPVRFLLDFLRIEGAHGADPRYAGLTPAQWSCLALFGLGVGLAHRVITGAPSDTSALLAEPSTPGFTGAAPRG